VWACPTCQGRAVSMAVLEHTFGAVELVGQLNEKARPDSPATGRPCMICRRPMVEVGVVAERYLPLDVCPRCRFVWFDAQELQDALATSFSELAERLARYRRPVITGYDAYPETVQPSQPEGLGEWVLTLLGLPVEESAPERVRRPWVTWVLSGLIAGISLLAWTDWEATLQAWSFIPAEAFRHGGLTWLTAFFLHGSLLHLVGNLYFLWLLGDNVEDVLGPRRYTALILAATLSGHLLHWLGDPRSQVPVIGASGGISGIIAFYACRFPHARLKVLWWFWRWPIWLSLSVWVWFGLWVAWQLLGAFVQLRGFGSVSYLGHLGGIAAGLALWAWERGRQGG
jgi:membrane associated rhomboid family serine protease/Zn-finger nucleic acid-binding protein